MNRKTPQVHTAGHSTMDQESLMDLLECNRTQMVADVRSTPYSRRVPWFNREKLAEALTKRGMDYLYMGDQLGGRPKKDRLYNHEGRADYRRMALEKTFREGVRQLSQAAAERRVTLLCTERDPLQCHRALLVAHALEQAGVPVVHILGNGNKATHEKLMDQLLRMYNTPRLEAADMTRRQAVEQAMERQAARVAYRKR